MNYIEDTLSVKLTTRAWDDENRLPYYLLNRYEFKKAFLDGEPCIFMKPKGELVTLTALKKHISRVREIAPYPIALDIEEMTAQRRKSLIKARIPFIAPPCHIYLPFLGIALFEQYMSIERPKDILMPSSQLLLFYYLYHVEPSLRAGETAKKFGVSAMQISRAVNQLVSLGLVNERKDGVRIIISSKESRRDLFEKAKPHLVNPVRKRLYVEHENLPTDLFVSGYSALSELTMLGRPSNETFAYFGKNDEINGTDILIDQNEQTEVEIWRYDPSILSIHSGVVDPLSLVTSLLHTEDPRVEQSIDELLSQVWR